MLSRLRTTSLVARTIPPPIFSTKLEKVAAYGVEGETVSDPAKIQEHLARAKRANIEGRPYLLDILVDRAGVGAASEWYPPYSIAAKRTKKA